MSRKPNRPAASADASDAEAVAPAAADAACGFCREPFVRRRSTQRYCSSNCRARCGWARRRGANLAALLLARKALSNGQIDEADELIARVMAPWVEWLEMRAQVAIVLKPECSSWLM